MGRSKNRMAGGAGRIYKVSLSDYGNSQSVDLDFDSFTPCIFKLNTVNKRDHIHSVRGDAHLINRALRFQIRCSQTVPRSAKRIEAIQHTHRILWGWPNPEIEVFCRSRKRCAAIAYPPTTRNSTLASMNADNMSRKSGFSNGLPRK